MRGNFGVTIHQANCRPNLEQIGRIRRLPRANTTFSKKTFVYLGRKLFNLLPKNLANLNAMCIFNKSIKSAFEILY